MRYCPSKTLVKSLKIKRSLDSDKNPIEPTFTHNIGGGTYTDSAPGRWDINVTDTESGIEEIEINIEKCVDKLEDIKLQNFSIKTGNLCSGCFKQAYHLLNLMKTNMTKDLKYLTPNNSFLIGDNPPDPNNISKDNIILFGDCAIYSTRKKEFKIIVKESKKKRRYKVNKKVLKLSGCPPDISKCIKLLINYYGKKDLPMLNIYSETVASYTPEKITKKLRIWEVG